MTNLQEIYVGHTKRVYSNFEKKNSLIFWILLFKISGKIREFLDKTL